MVNQTCSRVCLCVCLSVCVAVCVSVCVHDNLKNNGSIHLKLEHIVVYENTSDDFDKEVLKIQQLCYSALIRVRDPYFSFGTLNEEHICDATCQNQALLAI